MTCDELDAIRLRWHPEADATRPVQDTEDVRDLINELDCVTAMHVQLALFVSEIAESVRPLPNGFQPRAAALLGEQQIPVAMCDEAVEESPAL